MNYIAHLSLDSTEYEAATDLARKTTIDSMGHETARKIILDALDGKCSATIQHAVDKIKHES